MIEEEKDAAAAAGIPAEGAPATAFADSDEALKVEPLVEQQISIDDFTKVDLRVARIIEAAEVPDAKKLLKLKLSLGGDVTRHLRGEYVSVYVPTTPNPTSGFFLMLPRKDIIELDMSVDEALKYIISMGVVAPPMRNPAGRAQNQ